MLQTDDLNQVAREALLVHAKERGLSATVSADNVISFGVGDLACKCEFVKGSSQLAQVEFVVWTDASRKQAYIDQCSAVGDSTTECVVKAVHSWCEGQLPPWLAVYNGEGVAGLATTAKINSFDDATMQSYQWQLHVGIAQYNSVCASLPERVQAKPPYELIIGELMQLQMKGYFKSRTGLHCLKLFYGRTMDGEVTPESKIDGDHWDGANLALHNYQWTTEPSGYFMIKQFITMAPPMADGGAVLLAPQSSASMLAPQSSASIRSPEGGSATAVAKPTNPKSGVYKYLRLAVLIGVIVFVVNLLMVLVRAFTQH